MGQIINTSKEHSLAMNLITPHLPQNAQLFIEEPGLINGIHGQKYLLRVIYTSQKTGRTMAVTAKTNILPTKDDEQLIFCLTQLVLSPAEIAMRFNRIYFMERTARQQEFLTAGKLSNIRVSEKRSAGDRLSYKESMHW